MARLDAPAESGGQPACIQAKHIPSGQRATERIRGQRAQNYCATAEAWLKKSVGMGLSNRQVIAIGRSPVWLTYEAGPRNR